MIPSQKDGRKIKNVRAQSRWHPLSGPEEKCACSQQVGPRLGGPGLQRGAHLVGSLGGWQRDSVAAPPAGHEPPTASRCCREAGRPTWPPHLLIPFLNNHLKIYIILGQVPWLFLSNSSLFRLFQYLHNLHYFSTLFFSIFWPCHAACP